MTLTQNTAPLVSILMTAYNRERLISEAIDSVLSSTYQNFELIIVDDCSTDSTYYVAEKYAEKDKRISLYRNKYNLGDYPNRNQAAKYANGEYIKYLDSDDVIYPHGLEAMVYFMSGHPEAGFGLSVVGYADRPHPVVLSPRKSYLQNFFGKELFGRSPGSSIIRRTAFEALSGFSGLRQAGDHEFWLAIARRYSMVTLPANLYWARCHSEQEQRKDDEIAKAIMHYRLQVDALFHPECPLTQEEVHKALERLQLGHSKQFWRTMFRGSGVANAFRYKNRIGVPWAKLFFVLLNDDNTYYNM